MVSHTLFGDILLAILDDNALVAAGHTLTGDVVDGAIAIVCAVGNDAHDAIDNLRRRAGTHLHEEVL